MASHHHSCQRVMTTPFSCVKHPGPVPSPGEMPGTNPDCMPGGAGQQVAMLKEQKPNHTAATQRDQSKGTLYLRHTPCLCSGGIGMASRLTTQSLKSLTAQSRGKLHDFLVMVGINLVAVMLASAQDPLKPHLSNFCGCLLLALSTGTSVLSTHDPLLSLSALSLCSTAAGESQGGSPQ